MENKKTKRHLIKVITDLSKDIYIEQKIVISIIYNYNRKSDT